MSHRILLSNIFVSHKKGTCTTCKNLLSSDLVLVASAMQVIKHLFPRSWHQQMSTWYIKPLARYEKFLLSAAEFQCK